MILYFTDCVSNTNLRGSQAKKTNRILAAAASGPIGVWNKQERNAETHPSGTQT